MVYFEILQDGPLNMLKHQIQLPFASEHLQQLHDVFMFQLLLLLLTHPDMIAAITFKMRISLNAVFRTCSFSSDSLNFFIATIWPVILCLAFSTIP
jgi:hypothetical protein